MSVSQAMALRVVKRAQLNFEEHVRDPRDSRGRKHSLAGVLNLLTAALSCQRLGLRRAEALSEDLGPRVLRRLGLKRSVSDTAMYELLPRIDAEELRPVLFDQLRRDLDSKVITNNLFPGGVAAFDGKGVGSGLGKAPNAQCRQSVCDSEGTEYWDAFVLSVCLVSSSVRPVLDREYISQKASEPTTFPVTFDRLVKTHPKLFRYVTNDAGLTSRANARLVIDARKHYVAALKANQKTLFPLAIATLARVEVTASTEERYAGALVRRELRRATIPAGVDFPGATEFWSVRETSTKDDGSFKSDERYFIVSIPPSELSDARCLQLVRLHWQIENGPNWTVDVQLSEDTRTQCTRGEAVQVLGFLRAIGYNLLAAMRAHLPARDRRPESWERAAELLRDCLVQLDLLLALDSSFAQLG